ncbi:MAG: aconitate hydratase B, partial [Epsilonproteobacteria bacterium]|nr:aconitate hydratase B [Campylobacterota bacterium]
MAFMDEYKAHVAEREAQGIPPLPLTKEQVTALIELITAETAKNSELVDMLANRVNPGVDDGAHVKAAFLHQVVQGEVKAFLADNSDINSDDHKIVAIQILGKMVGGYNVKPLINALTIDTLAQEAANQLKHTLLVYDAFNDVVELSKTNKYAKEVLQSWADAEWFTTKQPLAEKFSVVVFKFPGETNTDDLSPAGAAFTRSDIPLHATTMLSAKMPDGISKIAELKEKGMQIAYVGDVVGTGSSRKSAANSIQWHIGDDIPGIPNKRTGGVVIGGIIAPIFFATCEDSGALPIEADVTQMETGDVLDIDTKAGTITKNGTQIATFSLRPNTIEDEVRAGGRIPLIIGRGLTAKARTALGLAPSTIFAQPIQPADTGKGYTLAQKIVGKACGM